VLEAGGIAVIPGGVEHKGRCREDTEVSGHTITAARGFLAGSEPSWPREKAKAGAEIREHLGDAARLRQR
jgi:hypothetical protein